MFLFLTRLFALLGLAVVLLIGGGIAVALRYGNRPVPEPRNVILTLDFDQPMMERSGFSPLNFAMHGQEASLLDILRAISKAKRDGRVKGIVARFGATQPKLAEAEEIRSAIKAFRTSGKFTYAFAPTYGEFGEGNRAYFLASAFENIWLQPVGAVSLTGLALQSPFGKAALDKIGVKADFMQREEYKSFMDMATRDDFAPPVRTNMQSLIDDLAAQEAAGIAESRGFDVAHVQDLMARGPFTDEEALREKLVTRLGYADELDDELDQKAGKDAKNVDVGAYLAYHAQYKAPPPKARVALIYGAGEITGHDDNAPSITGEKTLGADTIAEAFDTAAADSGIKAILFRIDSPGGTPEASETIRRAMIHAQKVGKPVFVSMGDMAASGGYWIAMNADRIVAEPATLTGSIGVLAGKFAAADLLQKIGVSMPSIKTSDNSGMWSVAGEFTPQQRDRVNALLDNSYRAFTRNVAEARHIPIDRMPDIAKGRVWTGEQALKIGLVDELGGFATTLAALRKKLNLTNKDVIALEAYPPPETPVERMLKLLKAFGVEEAALRPLLLAAPKIQAVVGAFAAAPVSFRAPIDAADIK
jgi:protease-4